MERMPVDNLQTKDDILNKLRAYKENPDDWIIRCKENIQRNLLNCPELLLALGWKELEQEVINPDGSINLEGDWDAYFNTAIKPALFIPDVQTDAKTILCYTASHDEPPFYASRTTLRKGDNRTVYSTITFVIMSHYGSYWDSLTQLPRHDLIGSIIRERFNWSNIFGMQCSITEDKESTTDNNYIMRTIVLQGMVTNGIVNTINDKPYVVNNRIRD